MEVAVRLTDVFAQIFDHCDARTLSRCARVCTAWHEEALKRLWRGSIDYDEWITPSFQEIEQMDISASRLQYYLRHTRFYIIHQGGKPVSSLTRDFRALLASGHLTAPRAEFLLADITTDFMDESTIVPLLAPTLRAIQLYGGCYTNSFLDSLSTRCPKLRSFLLDNRSDVMQSNAFVGFLESMPQLVSIELVISAMPLSEAVLLALLSRANLLCIDLGSSARLNSNVVRTLFARDEPHSAMSLRSLKLDVADGDAVRRLLPQLRNLQSVSLGLIEPIELPGPDVITPLSSCTGLRELDLTVSSNALIKLEDLICLSRSCNALRQICISVSSEPEIEPTSALAFEGHSWGMLTKNLDALECLELECKVDIDCEGFSRLAFDCPNLVTLELNTNLNAFNLRHVDPQPCFSSLETLVLTTVADFRNLGSLPAPKDTANRVVNILLERMPRLTRFWTNKFAPSSSEITNGHTAISRELMDGDRSSWPAVARSESVRETIMEELLKDR